MLKLTTDKQTDRQTDKQTNRQDKNNMPPIIRSGGLKIVSHTYPFMMMTEKDLIISMIFSVVVF